MHGAASARLQPGQPRDAAFADLRTAVADLAPSPGRHDADWPGLACVCADAPRMPDWVLYRPSLCVVAQGAKEAELGGEIYRYDAFHYLVSGAPLPARSQIVEATLQRPFYSVSLAVDLAAVHGLLLEMEADLAPSPRWDGSPPLRVSPLDAELAGALARFLRATRAEMDRQILAPAVLREVLYLLLQRDQGDLLHLAAAQSRHGRGVAKALHLLDRDYARRLDVPTLAREVGMSISSLHHRFKEATALTPIQYLKHVRLQKARALLVDENLEAAEAAHRVGYASPSQFSREFKKVFGSPPKRYALQQRAARA